MFKIKYKVEEQAIDYPTQALSQPAQVAELVRQLIKEESDPFVEYFYAFYLDAKGQINGINQVAKGSMTSCIVHPREVFKGALMTATTAIIVAHNHPSGDPKPSSSDLAITRRLKQAGKLLGVEVIDHVVVGDDSWESIK